MQMQDGFREGRHEEHSQRRRVTQEEDGDPAPSCSSLGSLTSEGIDDRDRSSQCEDEKED